MATLRFTREHEWIRTEGEVGVVGISDYAQRQLGDIVFVELPELATTTQQGAQAAVVESVKAASEVYAPASGEVVEVNTSLADDPGRVNADPMGDGWFFKIKLADRTELDGLMDGKAYYDFVESVQ